MRRNVLLQRRLVHLNQHSHHSHSLWSVYLFQVGLKNIHENLVPLKNEGCGLQVVEENVSDFWISERLNLVYFFYFLHPIAKKALQLGLQLINVFG